MSLEHWRYKLPLLLRGLFRRRDVERELDDEIEFHIARQAELHIENGLPEDEAWRLARQPFGNIEARKEYCRDSWVVAAVDRLGRDIRHATRTLRRDWRFTLGVFLLLALGIGANVAVFSLVDGILLEPLPYDRSDRLFSVREKIPERDSETRSVNPRHYLEWTECSCFEEISLSEYVQSLTLAGQGDPTRVSSLRVTPNTFSMLGVVPQLGRTFLPEDGKAGNDKVIVLSDELWKRQFGSDPEIVGQTVRLDAEPYTVIGVLPAGFRYYGSYTTDIDLYRPWPLVVLPWWSWTNNYSYAAVARLADGVSAAAALDELNSIQAAIADRFEGDSASLTLKAELFPLKGWVTARSREGLYLLLAAVGSMLLVACLNIANLMFVRATNRSGEAALRAALGATKLAIFRSIFIESTLLAGAGAVAGIALAWATLATVKAAAAAVLPRIAEVEISVPVLAVAVVLTILSTLAFGLLPAVMLTRVDPQTSLREAGRSSTNGHRRMLGRQILITAEVGLSVAVLIIAGLLLASFLRLDSVDRGFDASNVLTAEVSLPAIRYFGDNDQVTRFWNGLLDELESSRGVVSAGITSFLPLRGNLWGSTAIREGEQPPASEHPSVQYRFVSAGYFRALGLPLLAGRALEVYDYDRNSAVVSEGTARLLWGDANPIGRRFHWADPDLLFEVVGVVPDVPSQDLATTPTPIVYRPFTASGDGSIAITAAAVAIRTEGDPSPAAPLLRRAVASLDPELSISNVQTMQQVESASLGERRFQLLLIGAFAVASLSIAGIGIYAVLAYVVTARTHELAMRMALGAQRSRIMSLVIRQGMRPVLAGLIIGVPAAVAVGRAIASLLYAVEPTDQATLAAVVAVTLLAALAAAVLPARRAARPSLLESLRHR